MKNTGWDACFPMGRFENSRKGKFFLKEGSVERKRPGIAQARQRSGTLNSERAEKKLVPMKKNIHGTRNLMRAIEENQPILTGFPVRADR